MRLNVIFADRVGIAHEILAVFAFRRLNVIAVEVAPPHLYIDAPDLTAENLPCLCDALLTVSGVQETRPIDILPGARQRMHLEALLCAMADPVLAVDAAGTIVVANAAAADVAGIPCDALAGVALGKLFSDPALQAELTLHAYRVPMRGVTLRGEPFLLDTTPICETPPGQAAASGGEPVAGGVLMLHAPSRIGERLHALQHFAQGGFEKLLGDSPPIRALKARAARVAAVEAPLLILGETGTGKELIAHACHAASSRSAAPFLALNCAALPESLAESELFGYAPGTFTGAQRGGKPGLLELANHGTVFLDEIGEMSAYLQAKLLRFLNDGSFRRVGGERETRVDVRIISATHRNLTRMVAEHLFREDLFYRLNVLNLDVPALRERGEDILLLARHFIASACAQAQRRSCRLTSGASAALLANPWPGNVRQLENVIFRAVTMSDQTLLDVADLEFASSRVADPQRIDENESGSFETHLARFEAGLLRRLYPFYPSSRKLAAHLQTSHTTMANKLRKYGIPVKPAYPEKKSAGFPGL